MPSSNTLSHVELIDIAALLPSVPSRKVKDLIGARFGRLTVCAFDSTRGRGEAYWLCRCDCGNELVVQAQKLHCKDRTSCGCILQERKAHAFPVGATVGNFTILAHNPAADGRSHHAYMVRCSCGEITTKKSSELRYSPDSGCRSCTRNAGRKALIAAARTRFASLIGTRVGRLAVLCFADAEHGPLMMRCRCLCGTYLLVKAQDLQRQRKLSCGCATAEMIRLARTTHGQHGTKAYGRWVGLKRRTSVCDSWQTFEGFAPWIEQQPDGSIRRIDLSKPAGPKNCYVDTSMGYDREPYYKFRGKLMSVTGAVRLFGAVGVTTVMVHGRLKKGWTFTNAITYEPRYKKGEK